PDRPRRRRPSARATVCAPGCGRRAPGGDGACNRARMLYGRRRRPSGRGQLPGRGGGRPETVAVPGRNSSGVTVDRDKPWTGDLNRRALEPQPHVVVGLYDTTLRDGEQTVGVVLTPEDKLEIARALDEAGVDRIEAGFPRVSEDDYAAVRLIAEAGLEAEIWGSSRAVPAAVEALVHVRPPARL